MHIFIARTNRDPINFKEAMESDERKYWLKAKNEELESMQENNVWVIVDRPKLDENGQKPNIIDSKWVFKRKIGPNGEVIYKARLVIRGFKDKNEYELMETYAPVSKLSIVRVVLATINHENWEVCQMDVKTAFLNSKLEDEVIYMKIPEGFNCNEDFKRQKVCLLKRSIYGLKISSKKWYQNFADEALKLSFERDINQPCLFTWRHQGKELVIILYVDDFLLAGNDSKKLEEVKNKLCARFQMKIIGEPKTFLGMEIKRDRKNQIMTLTQSNYIEKCLKRFKMEDCKPQNTPMVTRQVKNREAKNKQNNKQTHDDVKPKAPYREAIGSLLYLSGTTRPDISFAVNYLARRQTSPTEADWKDVKRVLRYLKATPNLGITLRAKNDVLMAFTDSSFRDCEKSMSTGGYIIKLFGDVIAWRSHKQNHVTTSTCHAEYLSMSDVCQELISLDKACRDILGTTMYPIEVLCDNKSAVDCTQKEGNQRLKSFDEDVDTIKRKLLERKETGTKSHMAVTHGDFVKSCVLEGKVLVNWVSTSNNEADIMTKPLAEDKHSYFRDKILNL